MVDRPAHFFVILGIVQQSLCRQLNRVDDAVLFLERNIAGAITRHPAMYPLLAELHDSQERSAVARKVLEEGLRRYPESEDLLYSYGAFLEQKSEHRAAMDIMQKLVAINPSNAAALNFVGYSWANDGINLQMALDYIQRALELMPDKAVAAFAAGGQGEDSTADEELSSVHG